jgi:hypothetical protein
MMLQKWLTLSHKDHFTPEYLKKLCENLDKRHLNLLLHTEIRWLSRGSVLNRVFVLKAELQDYFQENNRADGEQLEKLASLADIFHYMNQLNKCLQGTEENVLLSSDKILGFNILIRISKF